jgi:hypothetical protein
VESNSKIDNVVRHVEERPSLDQGFDERVGGGSDQVAQEMPRWRTLPEMRESSADASPTGRSLLSLVPMDALALAARCRAGFNLRPNE